MTESLENLKVEEQKLEDKLVKLRSEKKLRGSIQDKQDEMRELEAELRPSAIRKLAKLQFMKKLVAGAKIAGKKAASASSTVRKNMERDYAGAKRSRKRQPDIFEGL